MFSTPLICSSIGATTVEATTSALAPGYWPVTLMIGGAISGYCATGRRENATAPRITNTTETTEAKIGRSIKKCEMRMHAGLTVTFFYDLLLGLSVACAQRARVRGFSSRWPEANPWSGC